jgi:hypothetical protein
MVKVNILGGTHTNIGFYIDRYELVDGSAMKVGEGGVLSIEVGEKLYLYGPNTWSTVEAEETGTARERPSRKL